MGGYIKRQMNSIVDKMVLSGLRKTIDQFRLSSDPLISLVRDLLWVVIVVGGIALFLYLVCGTWPAVVTVESESMVPHMNVGDLVLVVKENRFGSLQTWENGTQSGYQAFGDYGDVIIYKPNGGNSVHPIIHRAMAWLNDDQVKLYYPNISPHAGYITKGDHNSIEDQGAYYRDIGFIEPVKQEWVIGKALIAVPLLGYPALHLFEFAVIIIVILIVHEIFFSKGEEEQVPRNQEHGKKKRKKR